MSSASLSFIKPQGHKNSRLCWIFLAHMQSYENPWPSGFSAGECELCLLHCAQGYSVMLILSFQTHAYFLIGLNSDHCPRHCVILNNFYWLFWQLPLEKRLIALGRLGVRSNKVKFWDLSFPRLPKVQKGRFLSIVHWENFMPVWLPQVTALLLISIMMVGCGVWENTWPCNEEKWKQPN